MEKDHRKAQIAVEMLFLAAIVVVLISGFVSLAASFLQLSVRAQNKLQALAIAEAGVDYYRWHLSYAPQDYTDGTGHAGPYAHPYYDGAGNQIGQFILDITAPGFGSSQVRIQSTGKVFADGSVTKIVKVSLAPNTLMQYNLVQNDDLQVGSTTTLYGPVMANGGIDFEGFAYGIVKSAQQTFMNNFQPGNKTEWGVYTAVPPGDPQPPTPFPARPDVFSAGRTISAPAADFDGLSQVLANLQALAQNGGVYASSSGAYGFDLAFATSTAVSTSSPQATATITTYMLYKVTSLAPPPNGCTNTSNEPGWGSWSVGNETLIASGTVPANGAFFFNDDAWVRGHIANARIDVGSAAFPDNSATWTNLTVNNSLEYSNFDGSDSLLLIAQDNINVGLVSDDTLVIDGALIAEHGRVGRFYYQPPNNILNPNKCAPYATLTSITSYGSIVSNSAYGFGFGDGTGYQSRQLFYDINLYNNPPAILDPIFHGFNVISWEEVQ